MRVKAVVGLLIAMLGSLGLGMSVRSGKVDLDAALKETLGVKFQKKSIQHIYLAGPQKTFNACALS